MRFEPILALVLGLCGCAETEKPAQDARVDGQTYAEALRTMCDVDTLAKVDVSEPLASSAAREEYMLDHVKNPDGIYFLTIFRTKTAFEQGTMLAKEAAEHGVSSCPLSSALCG